jgi:hypothetical protein
LWLKKPGEIMDSILPIFFIILVVFLVIWGILFLWRTSMALRLMDSFSPLPSRVELKPVPANEVPEAVNEALDKISPRGWHPQPIHGPEKVGDFKAVGLPGYLTLFRDDKEKMIVRMGSNLTKGYIGIRIDIFTYFTDGSKVTSTNALVAPISASILPRETIRHFPDCMPEDLVRLHIEYIAQQTSHLQRQEIPGDIVKFIQDKQQEEIEIKIKQGKIIRDKDKRFLNYSFFYAFALASNILKHQQGRAGKHRCTITGIPYKEGFHSWINPGFSGPINLHPWVMMD